MPLMFALFSKGEKIEDKILLRNFQTEGVGIFESMRTYHGRIFREEGHLERFRESAKTAGVEIRLGLRGLHRELAEALEGFHKEKKGGEDLFIRLTLYENRIFVMIGERRHSQSLYKKGVVLRTSPVCRSHTNAATPEAKTSAFQNAVLASLEPGSSEVYEWIFLDPSGYVTEARIGNIFVFKKNGGLAPSLMTPPTWGILNGVTRRFVIECVRQAGTEVKEVPLTRHQIFNAEEAFLTNTSWEILPIRELDGRRIGKGVPGPNTLRLHQIFRRRALEECRKK